MSNQSLSSLALTKVAMSTSYLPSFTPVTPFTLNVTQLSNDEDTDLARKQLLHENPKSFDVHGHRELLEHELLICYVSRTLDFFCHCLDRIMVSARVSLSKRNSKW